MIARVRREGIGVIVLAAGSSRRFQGDKRSAPLIGGRGLLETTLSSIPATFVRRLLVLRPGDDELAARFQTEGWETLTAADAGFGMGHSLAAGIMGARDWQGALIALGDMPWIRPATYTLLQEALAMHALVVPIHQGRRGNPVGFRSGYFDELAKLQGDRGARQVLERHREDCFAMEVDDSGVLRDVDTRSPGQAGG